MSGQRPELTRLTQLYAEDQNYADGLALLDRGGVIDSFTIRLLNAGLEYTGPQFVNLPSAGLDYPPQMIAQIKTLFEARRHAIADEIHGLLDTLAAQPRSAALPAAARTPPRRPAQPLRR